MSSNLFLRRVLLFDAATCIAMGLLLALAAGMLADLLRIDAVLLREAGIFLLSFALFVFWAARKVDQNPIPAEIVVAANAAWVAASLLLIVGEWARPNPLGIAFVLAQAVAVAGLAALQGFGLRRGRLAPR